jgi:hypothetical protein
VVARKAKEKVNPLKNQARWLQFGQNQVSYKDKMTEYHNFK